MEKESLHEKPNLLKLLPNGWDDLTNHHFHLPNKSRWLVLEIFQYKGIEELKEKCGSMPSFYQRYGDNIKYKGKFAIGYAKNYLIMISFSA